MYVQQRLLRGPPSQSPGYATIPTKYLLESTALSSLDGQINALFGSDARLECAFPLPLVSVFVYTNRLARTTWSAAATVCKLYSWR